VQVKVSVIVPVYNAGRYLRPCVESLLSQTLQECEFIFVNDGSSDDSCSFIEDYQSRDARIILLNQSNQGVSAARNKGMSAASGSYIGFTDADDTLEPGMLETMYTAAVQNDCDIVITNMESRLDGHSVITRYPFEKERLLLKEEIDQVILPYFVRTDDCNTACTKLYRRETIASHGIAFPERVELGEDGVFNMNFLCYAERAMYLDYTGYHYRETEGSATRNIASKDYFKSALEVLNTPLAPLIQDRLGHLDLPRLRAVRFIRTVMAILHIYARPGSEMGFRARYEYIRRILNSPQVQAALPYYYEEEYSSLSRYHRMMVDSAHRRRIGVIYLLSLYSRIRTKEQEGTR